MNVGVFTYDFFPFIGGQGRHVFELYKQNEKFNKVNLFIFSPSQNNLKNHIQIKSVKTKLKHIGYSITINREIIDLIKKYKLNIVHIHGGPGGLFFFSKLSIPIIYTAHHTYWQQSHYIKSQSWKYLFYILEKKSYQYANKIICVSKDTQDIITQHYGIDKKITEYIPNGINKKLFPSKKINRKVDKKLLYVGRIDKRKGVDFLIKTMTLVNKQDPNIELYIVGNGKNKNKLEKYSKNNNLNVKFFGHLSDDELNQIYNKISIQIIPSVFEGFGISIIEAMSKMIPVIATNVDGIKSIVNNKVNGILVNYGDTHSLAQQIINLSKNSKLKNKLKYNAYKGLKNYDWGKIYLKTIKIYEDFA